ncbi:response regulator [Alteromonas gracilis]|uniref:response regulator n=1 Tax=Alteromonas gracilis TaxID=1479524 RepID=UPI0030CBB23F
MTHQHHILIVEDEVKIAKILADYFALEGFTSSMVHCGAKAEEKVKSLSPSLIILDRMLPNVDGVTLCKQIRRYSDVPILMLTARVDEIDRLIGLNAGADDYVCKPFSPKEVVARAQAILRRSQPKAAPSSLSTLSHGDLHLDLDAYVCQHNNTMIELTPVEFRFLKTLMQKPGKVFSREQLMEKGYLDDRIVSNRTIDSHMKNLRQKLDIAGNDSPIQAVYAVGYKLI